MPLFRRKTHLPDSQPAVASRSFAELVTLKHEIEHELRSRQASEVEAIQARVAAVSAALGLSPQELLGLRTSARGKKRRQSKKVDAGAQHGDVTGGANGSSE